METPGADHRAKCARVLDARREADFAEQRAPSGGVSGMWFGRTAARNVAHLSAHMFVLASRDGVPEKVIAQLIGHANVDTTLNVYTQVLDGATRAAVDKS